MAEALSHVNAHQAALDFAQTTRDHQRIEDHEEIESMLDGLPQTEAEIVRQFHIEGRSYARLVPASEFPRTRSAPPSPAPAPKSAAAKPNG